MKPKILDLFCRVGGAGMGYKQAGFDIYGVDIEYISEYPGAFHHGDALSVMRDLLAGKAVPFKHRDGPEWLTLGDIDAAHASPPCQASSALTKGTNKGRQYLNLIPEARELLARFGLPTVIENVQGSDLRRDLTLCGEMFGLAVIRHRYFELGDWKATPPYHKKHRGRVAGWRHGEYFDGPYFAVYGEGGGKGTVKQWQDAMGIHWTNDRKNLAEAIPPAYTEFIGTQLMEQLTGERELAA